MQFKVILFADSFQTIHQAQVRRAGYDPAWAAVCQLVNFPGGEQEPPDKLLQAARFAKDAKVGDTMVIVPGVNGRQPIVASFNGEFGGRPCTLRYLVGFTAPAPS